MLKILLHKGNDSMYFDAVSVALVREDGNRMIIFTTSCNIQIRFCADERFRELRNEQTEKAFNYLIDRARRDDSKIITLSDKYHYIEGMQNYFIEEPIPF